MFNFKNQMDLIVEKADVVDVLDLIGEATGNIDYSIAQYNPLGSRYYYIGYKASETEQDLIIKNLLTYGEITYRMDELGELVKVFKRAE